MELADIITVTEVAREAREDALEKTGWGVVVGDKSGWDDCGIIYNKTKYRKIYSETFNMGGTGRYAAIAVFEQIATKKRFVIASVHFPAHVESDLARKRRTSDTKLWTSAVWGLKRRVNALKRQYHCRAAFIAADWNVNFKRLWVRVLIKSIHPYWANAWRAPYPQGGTHHSRLIDATLFRGLVKLYMKARLLIDDDSSDHRPYIEKFVLT